LKGCDWIVSIAKDAGMKLSVISQGRFFEPILRVKQAIDEHRIGRPVLATVILSTSTGYPASATSQAQSMASPYQVRGGADSIAAKIDIQRLRHLDAPNVAVLCLADPHRLAEVFHLAPTARRQ
jgi:predicted dehydrogenase